MLPYRGELANKNTTVCDISSSSRSASPSPVLLCFMVTQYKVQLSGKCSGRKGRMIYVSVATLTKEIMKKQALDFFFFFFKFLFCFSPPICFKCSGGKGRMIYVCVATLIQEIMKIQALNFFFFSSSCFLTSICLKFSLLISINRLLGTYVEQCFKFFCSPEKKKFNTVF